MSENNERVDIRELQHKVIAFRDARNWKQFHTIKNLSAGLAIESAELQELFLWKSDAEIDSLLSSEQGKKAFSEELADILIFLLYLADSAKVDLIKSVNEKIDVNEKKYPKDKSYNSNKKYTEL